VRDEHGVLCGVEAVIDKDLCAALLAESLDADLLLLLTDVPYVELNWGTPGTRPLRSVTADELRAIAFASGSMAPKAEAVCRFVERTGGRAAIGALEDAARIARGDTGTQVCVGRRREERRPTLAVTTSS
jgi:carbamate kinase